MVNESINSSKLDFESKLRSIAAAIELATGHRPSPATVWRWKTKGCKGIPLPYVQVGGVPMISLVAARQWLVDVTEAAQKLRSRLPETALNRYMVANHARANAAAKRLADEVG